MRYQNKITTIQNKGYEIRRIKSESNKEKVSNQDRIS